MQYAISWFLDRESERASNPTYRRQRVVRVGSLFGADYIETAIHIGRAIEKDYKPTGRGRPKPSDVKEDVVRMCLGRRVAVVVMEEAEFLSADGLQAARDIMATAEDEDPTRHSRRGGIAAGGTGIVLVGDESVETKVGMTNEATERWTRPIHVSRLGPDEVVEVYDTWFPGFAADRAKMGPHVWPNYLTSLVCRGRTVSFRLLENHARGYALHMQRLDPSLGSLDCIPLDLTIFQQTFDETLWSTSAAYGGYANNSGGYSGRTSWGGRRGDD